MLAVAPAGEGVGHNSLGELELTERAFKEALRLIPPVPAIPRPALRDFEFGGYHIPAGTNIGINPAYTHLIAESSPEPELFDPTRFAPEAGPGRPRYALGTFGGRGPLYLRLHPAYLQAKHYITNVSTHHTTPRAT